MKKDKDWLLHLDRTPTLEELQEHFREHDFSAAAIRDIDYDTMSGDEVEFLEYVKGFMDEHWEAHSQEMGLSSTNNYGKENPLIAMRDNLENLVSTTVLELLTEKQDTAAKILEQYFSDPDLEQKVDAFLHNAVGTTMQVMDYPRLVQVMKEIPTYEDFNHYNKNNRPRIDFHRKWEHSRAKIKVTSLDEMEEVVDDEGDPVYSPVADESVNVEEQAFSELKVREFWASLNEDEQHLLQLKMDGLTTQDIAAELGLKTHSAGVKRLQKLKKKYDEI